MRKIFSLSLTVVVISAFLYGFISNGDPTQKSQNNTVTGNYPIVVNGPALSGPLSSLSESFEGATFPPAGWTKITPTTGAGYNRQTAGTTPVPGFNGGTLSVPVGGGTALGFCNYVTGTSGGTGSGLSDQWLITPQITNVQPNDSLSFWIWKFGTYADNMIIRISTTTPTVAGMTIRIDSLGYQIADSGWVLKKYRIGNLVPAGSNIYIGFREWVNSADVDGASFGLDLVNVTSAPVNPIPTGTWTEQTSGLTSVLYSVSAVSDDVAWVCGAAGKVLRTTNKGVTWTNISGTLPVAAALYNIYAYDANTAVVTGVTGTNTSIYQTSNAGTTWTVANTHAGFGDDMFMTDANTAYFIGDPAGGNWDLLKSTNAGLNWGTWTTLATTNTAGTYNNAFWQQGTQVWFPNVGLSQMYYSSNLGANWVTQTITLSEIASTCFNTPTTGMIGGSSTSAGLLKTTDAGTTWTALTSPYTVSISGIAGAQTSWWISQQGLNISYSSNDGASWATQYTVAAGSFYHMQKSRAGATIWAVRSNGGISRYGQPIIGINPVSNEIPSSYSVTQNYPNPFNPTTKINFALPKSGLVTMKVYDMLGKEVSTLVNEVKNAGTYSVDFNASALSSGIYFYKVSVNGFTEVKKMMLIK